MRLRALRQRHFVLALLIVAAFVASASASWLSLSQAKAGVFTTNSYYLMDNSGKKTYEQLSFQWGSWYWTSFGGWHAPIDYIQTYANVWNIPTTFVCWYQEAGVGYPPRHWWGNTSLTYYNTPAYITTWGVGGTRAGYYDLQIGTALGSSGNYCAPSTWSGGAQIIAKIVFQSLYSAYFWHAAIYTSFP